MHAYWTKQPVGIIEEFIKKNTKPGDVVLDCFCGTGTTGLAASICGRNAILNDLSPICYHISKGYCSPVDDSYDPVVKSFTRKISELISPLYKTKCSKCGSSCDIDFTIVGEVDRSADGNIVHRGAETLPLIQGQKPIPKRDRSLTFDSFEPIEIVYHCKKCKEKIRHSPNSEDRAAFFEDKDCRWYPTDSFFGSESKRNIAKGITTVDKLYSKRNLTALSIIYDEIQQYEEKYRSFLMFAFTSILFNCSLMSVYRHYENTSIRMGTLYVPEVIKDNNVLSSYVRKLQGILKTKKEISSELTGKVEIHNKDSRNLVLAPNSANYAYIDPPYSDILNYSQLNIVWESWLQKQTDSSNEIIVNEKEGKSIDYYAEGLTGAFRNVFNALKYGSKITVIFHHPKIESWVALQRSLLDSGFSPSNNDKPITLKSESKTSSQITTKKLVQGFLAIEFVKKEKQQILPSLSESDYMDLIQQIIAEAHAEGYTSPSDTYDFLMNALINRTQIKSFNPSLLLL